MRLFRHFFVLGFLLGCLLPGAALADSVAPRTITISGHGETAGIPDTVRISAGVTVHAATAVAALRADSAQMDGVFSALKAMGVPDRAIQTSQFTVSPQYSNTNNEPPRLTGYEVTNQVTVTLKDVGKLGATLDSLVTAGANQVNNIEFSNRDSAALMTQARQTAVTDAVAKAQIYAKAAGVTLGPILSISESGGGNLETVVVTGFRAKAQAPVMVGEQKLGADVTMVWEIH
jgi:uncharacterized protein YggE